MIMAEFIDMLSFYDVLLILILRKGYGKFYYMIFKSICMKSMSACKPAPQGL
jgi:hypothetical protein